MCDKKRHSWHCDEIARTDWNARKGCEEQGHQGELRDHTSKFRVSSSEAKARVCGRMKAANTHR